MMPFAVPTPAPDQGVSKHRQLAFDVVGEPRTVDELVYVIKRMCQVYIASCKDGSEARKRVQAALVEAVQAIQAHDAQEEDE